MRSVGDRIQAGSDVREIVLAWLPVAVKVALYEGTSLLDSHDGLPIRFGK